MSSVYAQKNKDKQKKRAFGRDLTNRVNNEENSLENIKKEIKDTLENLKKSQSSNPSNNISSQKYPMSYPKNQVQNHLLNYSETALNGYGARQNFQKQKFEKKISKKVSLTELQFDCYGVKPPQNGSQKLKIGQKSKLDLQKKFGKGGNIQNYLAHTSLRRVEKKIRKGSSQKKFLSSLGRSVPVSKPDNLSKMEKLIAKTKVEMEQQQSNFQKSEPESYKRPPMVDSKSSNKCMKIEMGPERAKVSVDKKPRTLDRGLLDSSRVMKEEPLVEASEASDGGESEDSLKKRKNPQCVECFQADIFDFCMKTEVRHSPLFPFLRKINKN